MKLVSTQTTALERCPASGRIVRLARSPERSPCPVCGRALNVKGRRVRGARDYRGQIPQHKRADLAAIVRVARGVGRAECRAATAESRARSKARRNACKIQPEIRAVRARVDALPEPLRTRRGVRVDRIENRAWATCAKQKIAALPKDPSAVRRQIERASGIDLGAVDAAGFWEHLSGALPKSSLERLEATLRRYRGTRRSVKPAIDEVIRTAKAKTWDDLESVAFVGQLSPMQFLREYPGLEGLRLPDEVYQASGDALFAEWGQGLQGVPF